MTQRLVNMLAHDWPAFDGQFASRGLDPLELPPDRFLNTTYWWAVDGADQEAIDKFNRRLWRPPKGEVPAKGSPWSPESETAAFAALAAQVGVGVVP